MSTERKLSPFWKSMIIFLTIAGIALILTFILYRDSDNHEAKLGFWDLAFLISGIAALFLALFFSLLYGFKVITGLISVLSLSLFSFFNLSSYISGTDPMHGDPSVSEIYLNTQSTDLFDGIVKMAMQNTGTVKNAEMLDSLSSDELKLLVISLQGERNKRRQFELELQSILGAVLIDSITIMPYDEYQIEDIVAEEPPDEDQSL